MATFDELSKRMDEATERLAAVHKDVIEDGEDVLNVYLGPIHEHLMRAVEEIGMARQRMRVWYRT